MIHNSKPQYVFFGTPEFAAIILEKLIKAKMPPALVICNPDRPVGRKQVITPPPAKIIAQQNSIPVAQPESLKIGNCLPAKALAEAGKLEIEKLQGADFAVVAAYNKIIPKEIIDSFPKGMIGVHPSLLPKYRGTTPIQSAILAGEKETGTTLFMLDEKVDHGKIVSSIRYQVSSKETYGSLMKKLAELSGDLLFETLPKFVKGEVKMWEQNHDEATFTKKFKTEDAYIDLEKEKSEIIDRKIRALNPEPGAWTLRQVPAEGEARQGRQGKQVRVKLLEAELVDGKIRLKKIQVEGKKPVRWTADRF